MGPRRAVTLHRGAHDKTMGRVYAVANQKGGVGKTTTSVNVAASVAVAEKRTLLIDIDPQGNASSGVGVAPREVTRGTYDVLLGQSRIDDVLRETPLPSLDLVPASPDLVGAEIELIEHAQRDLMLKSALEKVRRRYDYVFIDCPPSLGLLTLNALCAADAVLVPMQCEYYALEGLGQLAATIERVRATRNPRLAIEGVLLTMYDPRNNLAKQVADEVRKHFKVFETIIPRNVRLSEAPSFGKPALLYDVASKGAQGYLSFASELMGAGA
jgi:chromosome partitioning protein